MVEVNTPDLQDMRQAIVELLFVEGNHNCPSCEKSGRCQLQAVAYEVGMTSPASPTATRCGKRTKRAADLAGAGPLHLLPALRGVRPRRRHRRKVFISHRGREARIEIDKELANAMTDEQVTEAVRICPVGAILEKGVGYDTPIGARRFEVHSLGACSKGGGQ